MQGGAGGYSGLSHSAEDGSCEVAGPSCAFASGGKVGSSGRAFRRRLRVSFRRGLRIPGRCLCGCGRGPRRKPYQHPVGAVPDQPTGACGFRDGFGCQPGRGDVEACGRGRALADLASGPDAGDHGQAGQAWPFRAAAARHHMQGRTSRRAVERPAQRLATGRQHPRPSAP
jgi:hypothetical protein